LENISQIRIKVGIGTLLGSRLDENADCSTPVKFNISANLEELEQGLDSVGLKFAFSITTQPKVVRYQIEGRTDMMGLMGQIKKSLSPHSVTKVPLVLYDLYQQIYPSLYVIARMINAPSPSPELLSLRSVPRVPGEMPEQYVEERHEGIESEKEIAASDQMEMTKESYEDSGSGDDETKVQENVGEISVSSRSVE
jgi:hypothetical protein